MYFYSRYKWVLPYRENRYIIYTTVFFLLCFITSILCLYIKRQKWEGKLINPNNPPVELSMHTRQDMTFDLLYHYYHCHLQAAVKSDAGRMTAHVEFIYICKINIVCNLELFNHSNAFDNIRFY